MNRDTRYAPGAFFFKRDENGGLKMAVITRADGLKQGHIGGETLAIDPANQMADFQNHIKDKLGFQPSIDDDHLHAMAINPQGSNIRPTEEIDESGKSYQLNASFYAYMLSDDELAAIEEHGDVEFFSLDEARTSIAAGESYPKATTPVEKGMFSHLIGLAFAKIDELYPEGRPEL